MRSVDPAARTAPLELPDEGLEGRSRSFRIRLYAAIRPVPHIPDQLQTAGRLMRKVAESYTLNPADDKHIHGGRIRRRLAHPGPLFARP
jgi:hypothetical protein